MNTNLPSLPPPELKAAFAELSRTPPQTWDEAVRQRFPRRPDLQNQLMRLLQQSEPCLASGINKEQLDYIERGYTLIPDLLAGHQYRLSNFQLEKKAMGEGGAGLIYGGVNHQSRQPVAVKFLTNPILGTPSLEAEIEKLVNLKAHHYICRVLDSGRLEEFPYMVMERINGSDLKTYGNRKSLETRLKLMVKACQGVEFIHQNHIIHGDLKPEHLLIVESPLEEAIPKVIDFGISLRFDETKTKQGYTRKYAAPELRMSGTASIWSDTYALGVILGELAEAPADSREGGNPPEGEQTPVDQTLPRYEPLGSVNEAHSTLMPETGAPRGSEEYLEGRLSLRNQSVMMEKRAVAEKAHITEKQPGQNKKKNTGKCVLFRRELQAIVHKATAEQIDRRYRAQGLAQDLTNLLEGRPVAAYREELRFRHLYDARKFARRHRLWLAPTMPLAAILLGWLLLTICLYAHYYVGSHGGRLALLRGDPRFQGMPFVGQAVVVSEQPAGRIASGAGGQPLLQGRLPLTTAGHRHWGPKLYRLLPDNAASLALWRLNERETALGLLEAALLENTNDTPQILGYLAIQSETWAESIMAILSRGLRQEPGMRRNVLAQLHFLRDFRAEAGQNLLTAWMNQALNRLDPNRLAAIEVLATGERPPPPALAARLAEWAKQAPSSELQKTAARVLCRILSRHPQAIKATFESMIALIGENQPEVACELLPVLGYVEALTPAQMIIARKILVEIAQKGTSPSAIKAYGPHAEAMISTALKTLAQHVVRGGPAPVDRLPAEALPNEISPVHLMNLVTPLFESKSATSRVSALNTLSHTLKITALDKAAHDEDDRAGHTGSHSLDPRDLKPWFALAVSGVNDADPSVRQAAVSLLAQVFRHPSAYFGEAKQVLAKALDDPVHRVRLRAACELLASACDEEDRLSKAAGLLVAELSPNRISRSGVVDQLAAPFVDLPGPRLAAMLEAVLASARQNEASPFYLAKFVEVLVLRNLDRLPVFIAVLRRYGTDPKLGTEISPLLWKLGGLSPNRIIPCANQLRDELYAITPHSREQALYALKNLTNHHPALARQTVQWLLPYLDDTDEDVRLQAWRTLEFLGRTHVEAAEPALPLLFRRFDSPIDHQRLRAIQTLRSFVTYRTPLAADHGQTLIGLCDDPLPKVRRLALETIAFHESHKPGTFIRLKPIVARIFAREYDGGQVTALTLAAALALGVLSPQPDGSDAGVFEVLVSGLNLNQGDEPLRLEAMRFLVCLAETQPRFVPRVIALLKEQVAPHLEVLPVSLFLIRDLGLHTDGALDAAVGALIGLSSHAAPTIRRQAYLNGLEPLARMRPETSRRIYEAVFRQMDRSTERNEQVLRNRAQTLASARSSLAGKNAKTMTAHLFSAYAVDREAARRALFDKLKRQPEYHQTLEIELTHWLRDPRPHLRQSFTKLEEALRLLRIVETSSKDLETSRRWYQMLDELPQVGIFDAVNLARSRLERTHPELRLRRHL